MKCGQNGFKKIQTSFLTQINFVCVDQSSSSSIEGAEPACTMRDLPPRAGHTDPCRETNVMDGDLACRTRPRTPDTPTFVRRTRKSLQGSEPDLLHRCHFPSTGSLESRLSPSRSKSPWSRLDPYDSPEVLFNRESCVLS